MKTQVTPEQKLADWESAFNSIRDLQDDKALRGLIIGLQAKIGVITPGVV